MTFDQIKYFLEVSKCGSISQAASNLLISQPNLSMTIKSLEDQLNYKLFIRNSKGIELTSQGAEFLFHAEKIIQNLSAIKNIQSAPTEKRIHFSLCIQYISSIINPISHLVSQIPKEEAYTMRIGQASIFDVLGQVSSGENDLGLVYVLQDQLTLFDGIFEKNHVQFTPLYPAKIMVALSKKNPLSQKSFLTFSDIESCTLLSSNFSGKEFYGARALNDLQYYQFKNTIITSDAFFSIHLLEHNNCISFTINFSPETQMLNNFWTRNSESLTVVPYHPSIDLVVGTLTLKDHVATPLEELFLSHLHDLTQDTSAH